LKLRKTIKLPKEVKRPSSVDQAEQDRIAYFKQIDWSTSALYEAAINGTGLRGEDKLDIYTQVESEYFASMLKKKKGDGDLCSEAELKAIFEKALYTLKVLMESLLQGKVYEQLKGQYYKDQAGDNKVENEIKLLMRCYKVYTAREDTMKILRMLEKRENMRNLIHHQNFGDILAISSRILKKILHL
jgi:hypothetical protein